MAATGGRRRSTQVATTPAAMRTDPTVTTIVFDGIAATRTNPVKNVPANAPTVPAAERPPTTEPVSSKLPSRSFAIIGLTALSTATGKKKARLVRMTIAPGPLPTRGPKAVTIGSASQDSAPPMTSAGPISGRGSRRSAMRPPSAAPTAIPASTVPMIPVNVSMRDAHVWRHEAPGDDLEHEDCGRRPEDDDGRADGPHGQSSRCCAAKIGRYGPSGGTRHGRGSWRAHRAGIPRMSSSPCGDRFTRSV